MDLLKWKTFVVMMQLIIKNDPGSKISPDQIFGIMILAIMSFSK